MKLFKIAAFKEQRRQTYLDDAIILASDVNVDMDDNGNGFFNILFMHDKNVMKWPPTSS